MGYLIVFWPKCFKCLMLMPSGPVKLLCLAFCIACFVSSSEIVICDFCSFFTYLSMALLLCIVVYIVVLITCLLDSRAFSDFFYRDTSCCLAPVLYARVCVCCFGGPSCM